MKYVERQSGLVVPEPPPKRRYVSTEIQDEDHRSMARGALLILWDALELSRGNNSILPSKNWNHNYKLYRCVGELLLGKDCPEKEVKT